MNTEKLNNLETRLEYLSDNIKLFQQELAEYKNEQISKPSFELSPEVIQLIKDTFSEFLDSRIIGQLDTSHSAYASGDGFQITIDFDLQECVTDALPSSHRLANDFIDDLVSELEYKQEAYEQSKTAVARINEHEDQQESENN